jgi:cytochrome c oxidase subunit 3
MGYHTQKVVTGLRLGVVLFIISEVMFFFSFFWAFLHSSLAPSVEIGGVWPPIGLKILNPFGVPLLNTVILLTSGATVTYVHYCIQLHARIGGIIGFVVTIFLAIIFTSLQVIEYIDAPFNLSDGIYASTFFVSTGFHGLHVIVGTVFLLVGFYRFCRYHFTFRHHLGFEAAAWYWHFVDVVWLFLFLLVYIWGSW